MTVSSMDEQPVGFTFVRGKDYLALPRDPQPWLIEKVVPSGGLMNAYGKPKLGKSYLALGIALAVSNPNVQEWLGFRVLKHGDVMYLQADTPRSEWASRVDKLAALGYDISNIHFTDNNLGPYPVNLTSPAAKESLKQCIEAVKPVLLVVDTLREVHSGDENDSGAMKEIIQSVVECTRNTNTSVLFVSHSRKDLNSKDGGKGDDDLMNDGRGSSYVSGRMDVIAKLTEKTLILKGRSISETKISVEQDKVSGLIVQNQENITSEAHIQFVMNNPQLASDRAKAEMLAALEGIELEAARSRIRTWKKKHGGGGLGDDGQTT